MGGVKVLHLDDLETLLRAGTRLDEACRRIGVQADSAVCALRRARRRGDDVDAVERLVRAERRRNLEDRWARRREGLG